MADDGGPTIALHVPRTRSRSFLQTRLRAAAFPSCVLDPDGGFSVAVAPARLSRFELAEFDAVLLRAMCWKRTTAAVDGVPASPLDVRSTLACWQRKCEASQARQAKHCRPEAAAGGRSEGRPEVFFAPCQVRRVEAVRWGDFTVGGRTDHAAMAAALEVAARDHPSAWCPGYTTAPTLAAIRKLPVMRDRVLANEQRRDEQKAAAWREFMASSAQQLRAIEAAEAAAAADLAWVERSMLIVVGKETTACLSRADWERMAEILEAPELMRMPDLASMSAAERDTFGQRLRELVIDAIHHGDDGGDEDPAA